MLIRVNLSVWMIIAILLLVAAIEIANFLRQLLVWIRVSRSRPGREHIRRVMSTNPNFEMELFNLIRTDPTFPKVALNAFRNPDDIEGATYVRYVIYTELMEGRYPEQFRHMVDRAFGRREAIGMPDARKLIFHPYTHSVPFVYHPVLMDALLIYQNWWGMLCMQSAYHMQTTRSLRIYSTRSWSSSRPTIIFFHGIGFGVQQYTLFLRKMVRAGFNVIAPEIRFLTELGCMQPFTYGEIYDELTEFLRTNCVRSFGCVSQSFGTDFHSWMIHYGLSGGGRHYFCDPVILPPNQVRIANKAGSDRGPIHVPTGENLTVYIAQGSHYIGSRIYHPFIDAMAMLRVKSHSRVQIGTHDTYLDVDATRAWLAHHEFSIMELQFVHGAVTTSALLHDDIIHFLSQ